MDLLPFIMHSMPRPLSPTSDSSDSSPAPPFKRTKKDPSIPATAPSPPVSPITQLGECCTWIKKTINAELTKKALPKPETIRRIMDRTDQMADLAALIVMENSTLTARLADASANSGNLISQFASILKDRDSAHDDKISLLKAEITSLKGRIMSSLPTSSTSHSLPAPTDPPKVPSPPNKPAVRPRTSKNPTPAARSFAAVAASDPTPPLPRLEDKPRSSKSARALSSARSKRLGDSRIAQPEETFVFAPQENSNTSKSELWTEVTRKLPSSRITSIPGKDGRTILKPHNKESSDVLKAISRSNACLSISPPLLPRVIIDSIDVDTLPGTISRKIAEQNPDLHIEPQDFGNFIKPVFKNGPPGRDTVSWVCEVLPKYYLSILDEAIFIEFSRCRIRKFERITQCFKCLRFGHPSHFCRETLQNCAHCARSGHSRADCPNVDLKPKCANCGKPHPATDPLCTKRTAALANVLARTDFGTPSMTQ